MCAVSEMNRYDSTGVSGPVLPIPFRGITLGLGTATAITGLLGIIGLYSGVSAFTSVYPGYKPFAFSAAVAWTILGLVLACHAASPFRGWLRLCVEGVLGVIVVVEAVEFPFNLIGQHFLIETTKPGQSSPPHHRISSSRTGCSPMERESNSSPGTRRRSLSPWSS